MNQELCKCALVACLGLREALKRPLADEEIEVVARWVVQRKERLVNNPRLVKLLPFQQVVAWHSGGLRKGENPTSSLESAIEKSYGGTGLCPPDNPT